MGSYSRAVGEVDTTRMYWDLLGENNLYTAGGESGAVLYHEHVCSAVLTEIEGLVKKIGKSKSKGYTIKSDALMKRTILKETVLSRSHDSLIGLFNALSPDLEYSEHIEVFREVYLSLELDKKYFRTKFSNYRFELWGDVYNQFVDLVRKKLKSSQFRRQLHRRTLKAKRNFHSGKKYIDDLFSRYSRLMTLRVDFGYRSEINTRLEGGTSEFPLAGLAGQSAHLVIKDSVKEGKEHLKAVKKDFARFLNNKRSQKLFEHLVGYIWKLEYGESKGYHYHVIFFYDGAKCYRDVHYARQLGEYWVKVTKGRGIYYNCNANKESYKSCGIGMVSHDDLGSRSGLLFALKYMAKSEQFLRARFSKRERTFGTAVVKPKTKSKSGRPRKVTNSFEVEC